MIPHMAAQPVAPGELPGAPLIDTHAHLTDRRFVDDLEAVLARAAANGIGAMVVVGYDLDSSRAAVRLAQHDEHLWAAVGIHPHHALEVSSEALAALEALARLPRVVAIGECGLDFYRDLVPRPAQQEAFDAQLALAARVSLPVVIHSRQAMQQTLATLTGCTLRAAGVMHCFDGTTADARRVVELGLYLSCAGPLTYRRDPMLAQAVAAMPLERLVLETDCPYLSPQGYRGQRNEPAHLRVIADALAGIRGQPMDVVARQTSHNAAALFRTPELAVRPTGRAA